MFISTEKPSLFEMYIANNLNGVFSQTQTKIPLPELFQSNWQTFDDKFSSGEAAVTFSLRCHQHVIVSLDSTCYGIKLIPDRIYVNLSDYQLGRIIRTKVLRFT